MKKLKPQHDLEPHLLGIEALLNVVTKKLVKEKSATSGDAEKIRKIVLSAMRANGRI